MKDIAASVRARLSNHAQESGIPLQRVLQRYVNERILSRLAESEHREAFVLKGAALFMLWTGEQHRSTKDLDLLGHGAPDADHLKNIFRELLGKEVRPSDGLVFDLAKLQAVPIREEQRYGGIRITTAATLARARIPVQIDVGFGDTVQAEVRTWDTLLDLPAPIVRAYTRYEVVAEKLEAAIQLQLLNSRMKDFFDLRYLATHFGFEGDRLSSALRATFARRGTPIPPSGLSALFDQLRDEPTKQSQWAGFLRKAQTHLPGDSRTR